MEKIKEKMKTIGLSESTIKTYTFILKTFFNHTKKINNFKEEDINNYLDYLIIVKNYSPRSRNLASKVIQFYCREFLNKVIHIRKAKENLKTSPNSDYEARSDSPKVSPPKDMGFIDGECQVCSKGINECECIWEEKPIS